MIILLYIVLGYLAIGVAIYLFIVGHELWALETKTIADIMEILFGNLLIILLWIFGAIFATIMWWADRSSNPK